MGNNNNNNNNMKEEYLKTFKQLFHTETIVKVLDNFFQNMKSYFSSDCGLKKRAMKYLWHEMNNITLVIFFNIIYLFVCLFVYLFIYLFFIMYINHRNEGKLMMKQYSLTLRNSFLIIQKLKVRILNLLWINS